MIIITGPKGKRKVAAGEPYTLEPGEMVTGMTRDVKLDKFDHIADDTKVGVGDLINAATTATGFKKWWNAQHRGQCLPCKKRQAALNYFEFKGPQWIHDWVESKKDEVK